MLNSGVFLIIKYSIFGILKRVSYLCIAKQNKSNQLTPAATGNSGKKTMTTYILINSDDKNILGVYTDREAAMKMMRVYKINGSDIYCQAMNVYDTIPAWAERVLELNA